MPSECKFVLNQESGIYYAGKDVIEVTALLDTSKDKNVYYVQLGFVGVCKVINTVQDNLAREEYVRNERKSAMEIYDSQAKTVHHKGVLPAGQYQWNFRCKVSERCLTSLEGELGYIRYHLMLTIKNTDKYKNVFLKPVTVIKNCDLNIYPLYKMPQNVVREDSCSFVLQRITVACSLLIPFGAYAPGQTIEYTLMAKKNARQIIGYEIEFVKHVNYITDIPRPYTHISKTILWRQQFLDNGNASQVARGKIVIPSIPPTTHATYIKVNYLLSLRVRVFQSWYVIQIPIIIGTVPIRRSLLPEQRSLVDEIDGELKPKFFAQAIPPVPPFRDTEEPDIGHVDDFLPMYPSYKANN